MTVTRRAPARPVILVLIAAMAIAVLPAGSAMGFSQDPATVWINEINYDNVGTDTGEAIEIAGPAGTSLSGWRIVLYNGAGGAQYDSDPLTGTIPDQGGGSGTVALAYPTDGMQNGSPDGVALVNGTTVVQFLSYEGAFVASNSPTGTPAAGLESTDVGVVEAGSEPVGRSLALTGTGAAYQDFDWTAGAASSFGTPNPGQTLAPASDASVRATCGGNLYAVKDYAPASRQITARDPDDTITSIQITSVVPANAAITLGPTTPAPADGGTASATLSAGTSAAGTFQVRITASNDDAANPQTRSCTLNVVISVVTKIGVIQGATTDTENGLTDRSPFAPTSGNLPGDTVAARGIVAQLILTRTATGIRNYGFFLQEPATATDGNALTSDGILVFMEASATLPGGYEPQVGDEIVISAPVSEFFSLTQLITPRTAQVVGHVADVGAAVPAFTVNPPADFAAANRYWERREGMQARVPEGSLVQGGRSVFPSTADAEIYFYRDDYAPLADRADPYERRIFRDAHPLDDVPGLVDNGNGFRYLIGALGVKAVADDENVLLTPARTNDVLTNEPAGGVYFGFSKYQIQVADQPTFSSGADPSLNGAPVAPDRAFAWTSATYNVENLYDFRDDPTDGCDFADDPGCTGVNPPFDYVPSSTADYEAQLTALATQIIDDLKAPDLIMTQEGEDQDICSVVSANMDCGAGDGRPDTLQELALRIASLGGPAYQAVSDRDGADDRGIVSGFLYRTDRVELLPASAGDPVLGSDPAVEYPTDPFAYNEDVENPKALNAELPAAVLTMGSTLDGINVFTRPPQVGHFRIWRDGVGTSVFLDVWASSNHFSSTPDGRVFQRREQAKYMAAIVDAIEADEPTARVIVGGDFNVYPQPDDPFAEGQRIPGSTQVGPSDQLKALYDQGLESLWDDLAEAIPAAAYSYVFQGQAQTLDSQFISDVLDTEFQAYRVAHINADFPADFEGDGARGASDHDPSQARYSLAVTISRLDALVRYLDGAGELRGNNTARNLISRLAKAAEYLAAAKTDASRSQLIAFRDQVADWSPKFIDPDVAEGLQQEVAVLLGD